MMSAGDRALIAKAVLEAIDREISIAAKEGKAFCTCDPGLDSPALVEAIAQCLRLQDYEVKRVGALLSIRWYDWEEGEILC
jgi:hypothetical protein